MTYFQSFSSFTNDPLSRFPQRGKASFAAPSPVGEGREGGKLQIVFLLFIITDTHFENFLSVYQVDVPLI